MAGTNDKKIKLRSSSVKESDKNKEKLCGKCKKGFTAPGERLMNCDMCSHWFHGKCTTLSDDLIREIDSIDQIKWFCESCQHSATGVLSQLLKIQKSQQDTENALNALIERYDQHIDECSELITKTIDDTIQMQIEDKVTTAVQQTMNENLEDETFDTKIEESIKNAINSKLEEIDDETLVGKIEESFQKVIKSKLEEIDFDKKVDDKLKTIVPEEQSSFPSLKTSFAALLQESGEAKSNLSRVVRDEVKEEVSEQKQIEALKMNLVITGLPEKQDPQTEIQEVKTLFEKELNLTADINKTERIGKPRENEPRLLRITFTTMRSRREVLVNSINLRNSVNKTVREKIFVRPDMTENQRKESKNLRELLRKMKRDNPTKSYMIKRNQVIEKPASPAAPTQ